MRGGGCDVSVGVVLELLWRSERAMLCHIIERRITQSMDILSMRW